MEQGPDRECGCAAFEGKTRWTVTYQSVLDHNGDRLTVLRTWDSDHSSTCDLWYQEREEARFTLQGLLGVELASEWGNINDNVKDLLRTVYKEDGLTVDVPNN